MITTTARILARSVTPALLASILLLSFPGEARACSCAQVATAEVVGSSDLVFVGEEIGRVETRQAWPAVAVTFAVAEAYKGDVASEMTVWTGHGGGDCGVGPTTGLVGIAAYVDGDRVSINICGSLHGPGAIAALLDPIEIVDAAPVDTAPDDGGLVVPWLVPALAGGAAVAALAVALNRRRRDDWHDGWSSRA